MGIQFTFEHLITTPQQPNPNPIITMIRAIIASALAASAMATAPAPIFHPAPVVVHAAPARVFHPAPVVVAHPAPVDETPKPFAFEYAVADDYSKSNFNAQETSDGHSTTGSYSVNLPDGRVQTVTYTVDPYAGYVADVNYEGTAQYPEYKPVHPAPVYHPAPVVVAHPAPVLVHAAPAHPY